MTNFFRALFLLVVLSGCSNNDEDIVCSPPPPVILVMLEGEATGENLIEAGAYEEQDIKIVDENEDFIKFRIYSRSGGISVPLGFGSSIHTYTMSLGKEYSFDIVFSLQEPIGQFGCTSTSVKELEVVDMEYYEEGGQVRIIIPQKGDS